MCEQFNLTVVAIFVCLHWQLFSAYNVLYSFLCSDIIILFHVVLLLDPYNMSGQLKAVSEVVMIECICYNFIVKLVKKQICQKIVTL